MSDKIDDGGAAFPAPVIIVPGSELPADESEAVSQELPTSGLFVRDYFAAAALTGMLANSSNNGNGNWATNCTSSDVAKDAYNYADEMILARKQK